VLLILREGVNYSDNLFPDHELNYFPVLSENWCRVTQSKVTVTDIRKLWKWPISKSLSFAGMHVIKRLMLNY